MIALTDDGRAYHIAIDPSSAEHRGLVEKINDLRATTGCQHFECAKAILNARGDKGTALKALGFGS